MSYIYICIYIYVVYSVSSPYLLVFGDDRYTGAYDVEGGFVEAWQRSGDSLGVFMIYGFEINCKHYGCFILF